MTSLVEFIIRHSRAMAILSLLSLIVPAWFASRARIDNSIEVWVGRGSEEFQQYEQFRGRYGSDELVLVAAHMPQPLSEPAVAAQRELAEALRRIPGVSDVSSLPESHAMLSLLDPQAAARPQDHPLIRNLLLSADGQTVGVVAWLKPLSGPTARRELVDAVHEAAQGLRRRGYEPHIVGTPVMNVALDRASSREAKLLLPIAGAFAVIVLVLLLRSISAAVACIASAAAAILWTVAGMVMAGLTLNLISVALPALLLVLSIAPGVHIASRFLSHPLARSQREQAMRDTLRELFIPIVLTEVTTVFGFASLMITDMQPVFEVGLFASIGIVLSFLLNFAMVPGLLLLLPMRGSASAATQRLHWTAAVGAFVVRNQWSVVIASLALTAVCAILTLYLRAESNVLSFLPADSPVAKDYRFVRERLTGLYTLELDVATPASAETAAIDSIARIAQQLARRSDVARVDHYGQFRPLLEQFQRLGPLATVATGGRNPLNEATAHFRAVENGTVHLRASILVRSMASEDFYSLVNALRKEASSLLPKSSQWDITGTVLLLNNAQAALVETQVRSFAMATITVLAIIGLLFWSVRVVAAAFIPNVLPIFGTFALMVVLGIPIDPATVMIASVAIGLAVDNTIHFVACYQQAKPTRSTTATAAADALDKSGRPIVVASVVAAAGFALLCLAEFRPLADFGLLTSVAMLTGMIFNLTITPPWASILRLWENDHAG